MTFDFANLGIFFAGMATVVAPDPVSQPAEKLTNRGIIFSRF